MKVTYVSGWPWVKDVSEGDRQYPKVLTDACSGEKKAKLMLAPDDEVILLSGEKAEFKPKVPIIGEIVFG
ncbi:MAG: hypothetical protein KBC21_03705 [Candidatus Pacebacteria bacterium]|nr:hypothetical protein [Candidatus Paceibacterota bacterium]